MHDANSSPLAAWESFYMITGSAAAALTGLMFVAVTLLPEGRKRVAASDLGVDAFSTPTVNHFCSALLVSAVLSAPWRLLWQAGLVVGLNGLAGVVYGVVVARRMWRVGRQGDYKPVREDWLWHTLLPVVAYVALVIAGMMLRDRPTASLFGIGAAALSLLFIGIHNAWDIVTYIALERVKAQEAPERTN